MTQPGVTQPAVSFRDGAPPEEYPGFSPGLRGVRERVDIWWDEQRFYIYIAGLLAILALAVLWPRVFITVPAGNRGVLFRTFHGGVVLDRTWDEGLHLIPPWDRLTLYETRAQEADLSFSLLTKDGLELEINTAVRYRPVVEMLGVLHQTVGPDYYKRVVAPDIEADLRRTVGDRTAYELYSTEGDILQESRLSAAKQLSKQNVELQELLLKKIVLPAIVREAIEEKHRQEQKVLEYTFRLASEEKEAERKRIEAAGIRDFESIAGTISPDMLRWRGIEATLELARSNNAKIVVVGGDGRLPVVLDTATPTATAGAGAPSPVAANSVEPRSNDTTAAERPRSGAASAGRPTVTTGAERTTVTASAERTTVTTGTERSTVTTGQRSVVTSGAQRTTEAADAEGATAAASPAPAP